MPKKKIKANNEEKPRVNPELDGFQIEIDSFGEIKTNFEIERINEFLNRHVEDKKLIERDDATQKKEENG